MSLTARLAICAGLALGGMPAQQLPGTADILARVRASVEQFEANLPDFVCNEKITSRKDIGGTMLRQTVIDSVFTGVQRPDGKGMTFTETREIAAVDGKPAHPGQKLKGPFFYNGGFSSAQDMTFGPKFMQYYDYSVTGRETEAGRDAVAVRFATKTGQRGVKVRDGSHVILVTGAGKAWFDSQSMRLLRLEFRYTGLNDSTVTVAVVYSEVDIGGQSFWMPKTVVADETRKSTHWHFAAEYSRYRKFDVKSGIKF